MGTLFTDEERAIVHDEELARRLQEEEDEAFARQLQDDPGQSSIPSAASAKMTADVKSYPPPPTSAPSSGQSWPVDTKSQPSQPSKAAAAASNDTKKNGIDPVTDDLPAYSSEPVARAHVSEHLPEHLNPVIQAAQLRAVDEQLMANMLQEVQYQYNIYNPELEPEHETDFPCTCTIHRYMYRKWARCGVQDTWNQAVIYPGEKMYNGNRYNGAGVSMSNPYTYKIRGPYPIMFQNNMLCKRTTPDLHARWITQTIQLNNELNAKAQAAIDALEPKVNIWQDGVVEPKQKGWKSFMKSKAPSASTLREDILREEQGRWPTELRRRIVMEYHVKTGMVSKIAHLRYAQPIQYLHLLRAGYFEPIPVAWANQASNPLKFIIEPAEGWRGITPAWRGYEDTAEERLYWVLNHREGSTGPRLKPDFISALDLARKRMDSAVPPPPDYFDPNDTCHVQHKSDGYSKQVMPPPFRPFDAPETRNDDTMILLDVSGSMGFRPQRPRYDKYLITTYDYSPQPMNKDVARAIVRRFTDAMSNRDRSGEGYDLVTFSNKAHYVGKVNHWNLDELWPTIEFRGGTRVMTGWQKVKELHFRKHSESATHHPVWGWQAGPQTPILRLLLLLDGEATDMDEFELDLLGLSWAHVTIFLIGVDGCPHHHRHANELQRISEVNHHVSFVDAQGNTPERFVTHELLKRHLGTNLSMQEFQELEQLPTYSETADPVV